MTDFGVTIVNYQPFLEMHVLLSDDFIAQLAAQKASIALLLMATLLSIYFLSVTLHEFIKTYRRPKRIYPPHDHIGGFDRR